MGCLAEASGDLVALTGLIANDYNDSGTGGYDASLSEYYEVTNCGLLGVGCTKTFVGPGVEQRFYAPLGGTAFAGPVNPSQVACPDKGCAKKLGKTLNGFTGGFGINSQADVNHTVFVLLYAPEVDPCGSTHNFGTPPGRPGAYGSFVFADIHLEDKQHSCGAIPDPLNNNFPPTSTELTPQQYATFAVSHELDEAITDPGDNSKGWIVPAQAGTKNNFQIADPCQFRNTTGDTYPENGGYGFYNYTRDRQGTVVAAYVDPQHGECTPDVATSIPPG
jgi:hypothetical protein